MENSPVNPYEAPRTEQVPITAPTQQADSFREMKIFAWLAAICIAFNLPFAVMIFMVVRGIISAPLETLELMDVLHGIVFLIGVVFYCLWKYRCACNARYFYGGAMDNTPGWCVGSYFIPILMLFRPYQCMKEIFTKTYQVCAKKPPVALLLTWWLVWILSNIVDRFALASGEPEVILLMQAVSASAALLVIVVIYLLTRNQYEIMRDENLAAKIGTFHPIYQVLPTKVAGVPMQKPSAPQITE